MSLNVVRKYDRLAEAFADRSWANLEFDMYRRCVIAASWGKPLLAGDSVLELGCGDGYLARLFVERGLRYRGVDVSAKMTAIAQAKLKAAGLEGEFAAADVSQLSLPESVDAIVSYMGSFFSYIENPLAVLTRFRPGIRKKIILDLNPRQNITVHDALEILRQAGFTNVAWRSFFVPKTKKLPPAILRTLVVCEDIPLLRSVPLHWKFHVLLKGEAS